MAKSSSFVCTQCGSSQPQWVGRCPSCGEWGSVEELGAAKGAAAVRLSDVAGESEPRRATGSAELDRVLGGGLVPGSVVLLSGDPGIGKSTLALQITRAFGATLYAAGEESPPQIKMRASRLGVENAKISITTNPTAESIIKTAEKQKPDLLIVDSIQTVRAENVESAAGAVNQIREAAAVIQRGAKTLSIPAILIGHVTKSGDIAGPMLLEHLVDVVLLMEQDPAGSYRMLRGLKNRFGTTDETGLFRMTETGMQDVGDPSELLLPAGRRPKPGSAIVASMEGRRPLILELQALTMPTAYGLPRRVATGVDPNRLAMLLAVLERRGGIPASRDDVYLNSAGGFKLKEPAVDLGIVAAVTSAVKDRPLPEGLIVCGEVGLGGEIRPVARLEPRLKEAAALGFTSALVPQQKIEQTFGMKAVAVESVEQMLRKVFS